MGNLYILGLAVGGIVWIYVSIDKAVDKIKKKGLKKGIKGNTHLKDALISIALIAVASSIFIGVTGMVIGMIASVFVSLYIRIKDAVGKKRSKQ